MDFEVVETRSQDVRRDTEVAADVLEPRQPREQVTQDQRGPALPDHIDRARNRARDIAEGLFGHTSTVVHCIAMNRH
ncbi:hypothetical protein ATO49_08165 [Mycolicibacterium fortuitum subsp. fortuitum DSM 46621 = ATCC 6841 = JCM 6387]|nr:hypothetical protein ATO49_08165 [Mycolicibacterium fortuitum subsp. fortuitum DSM 46621 = ATCC 6841 = JCM 6387]